MVDAAVLVGASVSMTVVLAYALVRAVRGR